jgi:hypothetical protein
MKKSNENIIIIGGYGMKFRFIFKCKNEEYGPVIYSIDEQTLVINDKLIEFLYDKLDDQKNFSLSSVDYFFIQFEEKISLIKIIDISYSFKMMFNGGIKNVVGIFDIKCKNITINNYDIGGLNSRGGNVEVYNSKIKSISFGRKSINGFDKYSLDFPTSLFIDNSSINNLNVGINIDSLKVRRCEIEDFVMSRFNDNGRFHYVEIKEYSYIKRIYLNGNIFNFNIEASQLDAVHANDKLIIQKYTEKFTTYGKIMGFEREMFINKNIESWKLIKMSAEEGHNRERRAEALYNIHNLEFDEHKPFFKWIFKYTRGYGYKPIRLIGTIITIIIMYHLDLIILFQ